MILQGVRHLVPYLGVSYANDPQKGGYMAYAPALDLTTLFEVIFGFWKLRRISLLRWAPRRLGGGGGGWTCAPHNDPHEALVVVRYMSRENAFGQSMFHFGWSAADFQASTTLQHCPLNQTGRCLSLTTLELGAGRGLAPASQPSAGDHWAKCINPTLMPAAPAPQVPERVLHCPHPLLLSFSGGGSYISTHQC